MRVPMVIDGLKEILRQSRTSRQQTLLCLGTAEYLLQFLLRAAQAGEIGNMTGVAERIRDVQNALYVQAGLINPADASPDPELYAMRALETLAGKSLLGEKPELMQNDISSEGMILHS